MGSGPTGRSVEVGAACAWYRYPAAGLKVGWACGRGRGFVPDRGKKGGTSYGARSTWVRAGPAWPEAKTELKLGRGECAPARQYCGKLWYRE